MVTRLDARKPKYPNDEKPKCSSIIPPTVGDRVLIRELVAMFRPSIAPGIEDRKITELLHQKTNNLYIYQNKASDQPCTKYTADQRLCFGSIGNIISLLSKSDYSSF